MTTARVTERIAYGLLILATVVVIAPLAVVVATLVARGWPAISWEFLTTAPRNGMREGGIFPAIVGTAILSIGTVLVALPLGVLTAVYLHEYARGRRFTAVIRLAILNLAGVPSIVHGLFGLGVFVILCGFGSSIVAGCLTLAILTLPVVIVASEEALRAVPDALREASLALGATRFQTVFRVVLPNAVPGVLTGAILGLGRAAGETAPILFTVAAFYLPSLPRSPLDQVMALPYHLYVISTQVPNMPEDRAYGTALVLLGMGIVANGAASVIRSRMRRRSHHG
ncbi:MAG TPA: phosphate ABC transporter permease PstA [Planctomycetota bacterium]|nr:phosphate ABC transporter permease PstA [Planctomycetota bacterium]